MKLIVHGLGRMGMQIARKLVEDKHEVVVLNRSPEPVAEAVSFGAIGTSSKEQALELFDNGSKAVVWLMLPSEIAADEVRDWTNLLPADSIIINGANSDYRETIELAEELNANGISLLDVGVSGGIWGYERGFPLMVGGESSAVSGVASILDSLIKPGGAWEHFGKSGSGNYVKMVHNAIEYGMMQSLGEGYRMLHEGPLGPLDMAKAGEVWQHHSVIESWLNELTRQAVAESPTLEGVSGYVAESGEARWALETADEMGITLPSIQAAFDVRLASQKGETNFATKIVAAQRNKFGGHNLNSEGRA